MRNLLRLVAVGFAILTVPYIIMAVEAGLIGRPLLALYLVGVAVVLGFLVAVSIEQASAWSQADSTTPAPHVNQAPTSSASADLDPPLSRLRLCLCRCGRCRTRAWMARR